MFSSDRQTGVLSTYNYTDDVDLYEKLAEWEAFYNCHRPHSAHGGKTPYEVLKTKLGI